MPDVYDIADTYRAALLRLERRAAVRMVRVYRLAWRQIVAELGALTAQLEEARATGAYVPLSWLYQEQRLQRLQAFIASQISRYAVFAAQTIADTQAQAVALSVDHADTLMRAAFGPIPTGVAVPALLAPAEEALISLVGTLSDGSPLRELLDELGPAAAQQAERALVTGVVAGQSPRIIARQMQTALGGNLTRSLRIARTETLRSYREASHRTYQRNNDLMEGWLWWSACDVRSCASCWAMHGTLHPVYERLDDHPNGRCSPVPRMRSWADLGYAGVPDTRPGIVTGVERFAALDAEAQQAVLGPGKYALFREGQIGLPDLVGRHTDPRWGSHRYERSLKAVTAGL